MLKTISNQFIAAYQSVKVFYQNVKDLQASEPLQNIFGVANLAFGVMAAHHLIQTHFFQVRSVQPLDARPETWMKSCHKVIDILGDLSLILNGIKSRPAVFIWKWTTKQLLSPAQLERFFGEAALLSAGRLDYACGLISLLIGIPSTLRSIYTCYRWAEKRRRDEAAPFKVNAREGYIMFKTATVAKKFLSSPKK